MTIKPSNKPNKQRKNTSRISLYPLSVEEAIKIFLQADPKKVDRAMKAAKKKRAIVREKAE